MLYLKDLKKISIIGMGLLGASVSLAILRAVPSLTAVGFSHRQSTRRKARSIGVADRIYDNLRVCVTDADIVVLASPIRTFEGIFKEIGGFLPKGCIVTDVGSTKVLAHKWARKNLGKDVFYVGSHPIAGSEKRGLEFARDDLFFGANCILTREKNTDIHALKVLKELWSLLGCRVHIMRPAEHDRVLGRVSHLPHITAAALVNASNPDELKYAGRGFIDTSRLASGPANIWTDILLTNTENTVGGIDRMVGELKKFRQAVAEQNEIRIGSLLEKAGAKRADMIKYKIRNKELL